MANTQLPPTPNMPMMTPAGQVNPTWQRWFLNIFNQINNLDTNFAPSNSTYIIRQADSSLPNAEVLSSLNTGFVKVSTGTGLLSSTGNSLIQPSDLSTTTVTPGSYTVNGNAAYTVDANGRITSAANVTLSASQITTGTLPAAQLPNPTASTLGGIESLAAVTSKWINTISTAGVPSATQPAFSDLSGNISTSQMNSGTGANNSTFWRGDGTWVTPGGTQILVQSVRTTAAATSGTTAFNYNNSIPQNTGGTQVASLSITPTNSSNILEIEFTGTCANSNTNVIIIALFQDSTAGALNCIQYSMNTGQGQPFHFKYYMTAGTTSSTTFKMRIGTTGGTWYIGKDGNATEGGVMQTVMTIKEYTS